MRRRGFWRLEEVQDGGGAVAVGLEGDLVVELRDRGGFLYSRGSQRDLCDLV